jgi:uncharacterized coiled-coil protein SlyX
MPNEKWTDFALTERFADLDKRLEFYDHALEGLSHFPIDVAKATLNVEHVRDEIPLLREEIKGVAKTCEDFRGEWKQAMNERQKGRTAIVTAIIVGCATVLAALVALVGVLFGGS